MTAFRYPFRIAQVLGNLPASQLALLEDRDRALEDFLRSVSGGSGFVGVYSQIGVAVVSPSAVPRFYAPFDMTGVRAIFSADTAGSSSSVATVYKNGSSIGTLTLGSSVHVVTTSITSAFTAEVDYVTGRITTAGAGATDLSLQFRAL